MKQTWLHLVVAGLLASTSLLAQAQYNWLDDKGMRVYSDRPPPPGIPPSRILKMPRGMAMPAAQPDMPAPAPAAAAPAVDKPRLPTLADQEAEFRKRAAQREADEKKAAQEASSKAAKDENCELARESERLYTSGRNVARIDASGERVFLSDEERAHRLERARKVLKGCR